jgi:hypothetical protein
LVSCSNDSTQPNESRKELSTSTNTGAITWENDESLESPIEQTLRESCAEFPTTNVKVQFKTNFEEQSLKVFQVQGAEMILFRDGALEPNIDDEASTRLYYDAWKCDEDTIFVQELNAEQKGSVFVSDCGYGYTEKPDSITLTCADGGMYIENIQWNSWSASQASGVGTLVENLCAPDCASGNYRDQKAVLVLGSILQDKNGKMVFSEISVQTEKKQVSGAYLDVFELAVEK